MKRAGRESRCTFAAVFLLTAAGCATTFVYTPEKPVASDPATLPLPLKVAVRPFEDLRGNKVVDHFALALVPFVPYGSKAYDRPEGTGAIPGFTLNPAEDFPRALISELRQSRLFRDVVYDAGTAERAVDLVVSGRVTTTRFVRKTLTYGLSFFGMLPEIRALTGLAGIPTDMYEYAVSFTVEMRRASDDVVVWSHAVEGSGRMFVGVYYGFGKGEEFAVLLSRGLHAAMESLANEIRARDLSYWQGRP